MTDFAAAQRAKVYHARRATDEIRPYGPGTVAVVLALALFGLAPFLAVFLPRLVDEARRELEIADLLRFIKSARSLGFSIADIGKLPIPYQGTTICFLRDTPSNNPDVITRLLKGAVDAVVMIHDPAAKAEVTEILRKAGVVGKFVEFFGPGLATLPLADRGSIRSTRKPAFACA